MSDSWSSTSMVDTSNTSGGAQFAPGGVSPRFYYKTVDDEVATKADGEPRFKDVEYVELRIPGDRYNVPEIPVSDLERKMYSVAYKHWLTTKQNPVNGRPIEELPAIMGSQVQTLRYNGINSIEELAAISDEIISRLPTGTRALVKRAQDWLDGSKGNASAEKLRSELSKRDAQLEEIKAKHDAEMVELRAQVAALAKAAARPEKAAKAAAEKAG